MKQRVLIIEDDATLRRVLCDNLRFEGFDVAGVGDGHAAVPRVKQFAPDLVLLDLMLPGQDGFALCRLLRQGRQTPIIILTARNAKADKLRGLELGADDYVTKPFDLEELLARIHAVLRRARPATQHLTFGRVTVDLPGLRAWTDRAPVELSFREFELLRYLSERLGSVVHRDELLRAVWGYAEPPCTRCVDHAIARLRRKLEPDPRHPTFIHTVHGDGYCLVLEGSQ